MSSHITEKPIRVGCVGGGQLGRMMALEAPRLNISMTFLDPMGSAAPVADASSSSVIQGSLCDADKLRELSSNVDIVTVEIEHVGVEALEVLENEGVNVQPSSRVLRIIRDKYLQKVSYGLCLDNAVIFVPNFSSLNLCRLLLLISSETLFRT
jgi:phosphoribosylaminoimidazole carboxylase (NCAIR synthetase)